MMQIAWRWTNGRLAEAPTPPLPSRALTRLGAPSFWRGARTGPRARLQGVGAGEEGGGGVSPRGAEGLSRDGSAAHHMKASRGA